jgi:hypothetical protein
MSQELKSYLELQNKVSKIIDGEKGLYQRLKDNLACYDNFKELMILGLNNEYGLSIVYDLISQLIDEGFDNKEEVINVIETGLELGIEAAYGVSKKILTDSSLNDFLNEEQKESFTNYNKNYFFQKSKKFFSFIKDLIDNTKMSTGQYADLSAAIKELVVDEGVDILDIINEKVLYELGKALHKNDKLKEQLGKN